MSELKKFTNNALVIEAFEDNDKLVLQWLGKSTERDPSKFLQPIFNEMETLAKEKLLELDFKLLEYMNSSTVTSIIKLLDKAKREKRKVTLLYNKSLKWQELSFTALTVFQQEGLIQIDGI